MSDHLTVGERVAWYRRRRGMSQEVLAGLVGRTADWLQKAERNRIELDRLSVIKALADALDLALGDLLSEHTLSAANLPAGRPEVSALRAALMDYREVAGVRRQASAVVPSVDQIHNYVVDAWEGYQSSRYGYMASCLPRILDACGAVASEQRYGQQSRSIMRLRAIANHAAAAVLTKLGEPDLAWIAAERGLAAAGDTGDPVVIAALLRSVAHTLLATGRFDAATALIADATDHLRPDSRRSTPTYISVYGTLFLTGAMAASRRGDRDVAVAFLAEADRFASRLGYDGNHLWTAFGPTNVAIHRVAVAMELGDVQVAVDLGPRLDTRKLPVERRVRHAIEVARALDLRGRQHDALTSLMEVEKLAPEQVRAHFMSRQLVLQWVRRQRGRPSVELAGLAARMHLLRPP